MNISREDHRKLLNKGDTMRNHSEDKENINQNIPSFNHLEETDPLKEAFNRLMNDPLLPKNYKDIVQEYRRQMIEQQVKVIKLKMKKNLQKVKYKQLIEAHKNEVDQLKVTYRVEIENLSKYNDYLRNEFEILEDQRNQLSEEKMSLSSNIADLKIRNQYLENKLEELKPRFEPDPNESYADVIKEITYITEEGEEVTEIEFEKVPIQGNINSRPGSVLTRRHESMQNMRNARLFNQ